MSEYSHKPLNINGLQLDVPIVQGGMGVGISLSGLAAAVANQGGVGVIASAGLGLIHQNKSVSYFDANTEGLIAEIRKARSLTNGILGVNVMVAMSNYSALMQAAIEEGIDIIFAGAGLPLDMPSFLKAGSKTKLVPIVSSARAARIICDKWLANYACLPDAFVLEGPRAGGHLGFKMNQFDNPAYALEKLLKDLLSTIKVYESNYGRTIPVIAAGGIYSGQDMYDIMKMGASAVQIATRFVTTYECDASPKLKNVYIDAKEDDLILIESPVGMPGRAINNGFLDKVNMGLKVPVKCPYVCVRTCDVETTPYCIIMALYNAYKGHLENGFVFAGSNAYKANKIVSVKDVFDEFLRDYALAASKDKDPI